MIRKTSDIVEAFFPGPRQGRSTKDFQGEQAAEMRGEAEAVSLLVEARQGSKCSSCEVCLGWPLNHHTGFFRGLPINHINEIPRQLAWGRCINILCRKAASSRGICLTRKKTNLIYTPHQFLHHYTTNFTFVDAIRGPRWRNTKKMDIWVKYIPAICSDKTNLNIQNCHNFIHFAWCLIIFMSVAI